VKGGINGEWALVLPDGSIKKLSLPNPHEQAIQCKYALSDEIRKLSEKDPDQFSLGSEPFYKTVEAIVCCFPEIPSGSKVTTGNYKAKVVGYKDCLKILTLTGSPAPNWSKQQWLGLIKHLKLKKWKNDDQLRDTTLDDAREAIDGYAERFCDFFWRQRVGGLVPLTLKDENHTYKTADLLEIFSKGRHYQIIGPSGSGKTELALHIALRSLTNNIVPIFIQVKHYTGDLSQLLDLSVSYLHPSEFKNLLQGCKALNKRIALIIDGFNECGQELRDRLLQDLQAFILKEPIPVLITSQVHLQLPQHLRGEVLTFVDLSLDEKRAVFEAQSVNPRVNLMDLIQPFRTPFELTLAAQCIFELAPASAQMTKVDLLELYTRRITDKNGKSLNIRELLIRIAETLGSQLTYSLPIRAVEDITALISDGPYSATSLLNTALGCNLLEIRCNRCSFRHEMFQLYFEAEAFYRGHRGKPILPSDLARPRNRHLSEFVIPMIEEETILRSTLSALKDTKLLKTCLRGQLGILANEVLRKDAEKLEYATK
jgi:DNA replication protein DnaC